MFAEAPDVRGVVGISVTPGYRVGPSQAPGKVAPLGVLGVLAVLGVAAVLGVLGVLVAWACATAGAMSTAAIESNGEMGSFFKTISSLCIPFAGACAQGPGEQRGLGWISAHRARLQQWLDRTIVQSIGCGIAENQPHREGGESVECITASGRRLLAADLSAPLTDRPLSTTLTAPAALST